MEARPKLKIELNRVDNILELLCLTLLILLWVGAIGFFSKLPDQIPSHYNTSGEPNDFSQKAFIFVPVMLATVINFGMTLLNKYPHIYNYSATVTLQNARQLYTAATKLIRVLKLAVVVIFSGIVFMTYKISLTKGEGLGTWFLPFALGLIISPTVFYLFKTFNLRRV